MEFDFGPISRTETGGFPDSFNLASLPLHEIMDALMAASNRDEFIAWLWHDIFKPLFWFRMNKNNSRVVWTHIANERSNDPLAREAEWARKTAIPGELVSTHEHRKYKLTYNERVIISDQFDQTGLGLKARFIQLAFIAEPATNTMLLRAVIADVFMELVTKKIAHEIRRQMRTKSPVIDRVRYIFEFEQVQLSNPPTDAEIQALANRYDIDIDGNELVITHFTPVRSSEFDGRRTELVVDFTATSTTPQQLDTNIFSLVELLTIYQDSKTIVMNIPQFLVIDAQKLKQDVLTQVRQRLQGMDVLTVASEEKARRQVRSIDKVDWSTLPLIRHGRDIDLLAHVFAEQVNLRLIDHDDLSIRVNLINQKGNQIVKEVRLLKDVVNWSDMELKKKSRYCRLCGSAFDSVFPEGTVNIGKGAFSPDFTDSEHIGFIGDMCLMCRIYELNSHQFTKGEKEIGKTGNRKVYRGSFAVLMPSSHFTYQDNASTLVEQPPLDIVGRFSGGLQRATFTSQEFVLFNILSRQVISQIWKQLNDEDRTQSLPLPHLGGILLTHDNAKVVQSLFYHLERLFSEVTLWAYPFKITVQPAIELTFEMTINDLQRHHTKHTLLKTNPITIAIAPESKFMILVDNGLQIEVTQQFFTDWELLQGLLGNIKGQERRRLWLLSVLQENDPVTATADSFYDDRSPFRMAEERFWDVHMGDGSLAEQWQTYENVHQQIQQIVSRYPTIIEFFTKPRR